MKKLIYSDDTAKIFLKNLAENELQNLDIKALEYYFDSITETITKQPITKNNQTININQSVELVYNFLEEPIKSIYDEILFTIFKFDLGPRGYFQYNHKTQERIINIPITKTMMDSYTIVHELIHYINSFPDPSYQSRRFLGEGISMSAEKLFGYYIKDENKAQYDINATINKINNAREKLVLLKHYLEHQEIILERLKQQSSINFLNECLSFQEPKIAEYIKYINGYIITTLIDDYEKMEYFNKQVSNDEKIDKILGKFNKKEYHNTIITRN